jgi:replicative DNA helicase
MKPAVVKSPLEPDDVESEAQAQVNAVQPESTPVTLHSGAELLDEYIGKLRTGDVPQLHKLGDALDGLEVCAGLITIIGAPPGAGKTALASQIVFEACQCNPDLIAYVANAEMSFQAIARRELTRITRIDSDKIRFANLSAWELSQIEEAAAELRKSLERVKFILNPTHGSLLELLTHEPGLIVVDYLQKFSPPDVDARIGVNQVMTTLRRLASHGMSVLALSATKRDAKGGHASKELSLSSFRESGEVEFNADSAYVLRDDGSMEGKEFVRRVTLGHVKNRHGKKLDRTLRFDMPKMSFEQIEEPEPPREKIFDDWNNADQGFVFEGTQ